MYRKILIVDNDFEMFRLCTNILAKHGYTIETATSAEKALKQLQNDEFHIVLTDVQLPDMDGIQLAAQVTKHYRRIPVVVITSLGSMETAVAALRAGAFDFITKPFESEVLLHSLENALTHHRLETEVKALRAAVETPGFYEELHGDSPLMKQVFALVEKTAKSNATVLITGESGTGKELVARALHRRSKRQAEPFVPINCSAMPEHLLESEFFGHIKGAFTDARTSRDGLFIQADKGTIFLDEIGDMPLGLQPKLLRALEEKTVRPLGSAKETVYDARVVAATNRNLALAVEDGTFREDLYYRFNVINIQLPPLRQRENDILVLAQRFIKKYADEVECRIDGFDSEAAERLLAYPWPGNVRELRNCMERAVALTSSHLISCEDLPLHIQNYKSAHVIISSDRPEQLVPLEEIERRYITRVLEVVGNNKVQASRILGLDRRTLYRKLKRWDILERKPT